MVFSRSVVLPVIVISTWHFILLEGKSFYNVFKPQQTKRFHTMTCRRPSSVRNAFISLRKKNSGAIINSLCFPNIDVNIIKRRFATIDSDSWNNVNLNILDINDLIKTAEQAALAAGQIIKKNIRCCSKMSSSSQEEFMIKTTIKDIVTQYDREAQNEIERIIRSRYPDHTFLGEEDVEPGAKASEEALIRTLESSNEYIWIYDPIDGTANFASGLSLCAVTVGVVYQGKPLIGVVFDPHANELFVGVKGKGATVKSYDNDGYVINEEPLHVSDSVERLKDAIINAGCPADQNAFETSMRGVIALNSQSRGIRMLACSALTTAWIAAGRLTAHFGYDLSSWDLMPGALLIQEAGGSVTDLDGSPYQLTTRNMLCSNGNQEIHTNILKILQEADAVNFERCS